MRFRASALMWRRLRGCEPPEVTDGADVLFGDLPPSRAAIALSMRSLSAFNSPIICSVSKVISFVLRSVIVTGHPKVTGHRTRFEHRFKETFMRLAGRMRLGFFHIPTAEAKRVQRFLQFPDQNCPALDPCIGDGVAFSHIASGDKVLRYGIELEANRAEGARAVVTALIQGNCFDVQCPVEALSLIYLNPPYDF